jgi:hypothetical protein
MLCCPLLCAVLPLAALALFAARHASSAAAAYPSCADALAATRQPYVRPFGAPSDHGRPGLSHVTLHGAVHHGAQEARVCADVCASALVRVRLCSLVCLHMRRWRCGSRRSRRARARPSTGTRARRCLSSSLAAARSSRVWTTTWLLRRRRSRARCVSRLTARWWCRQTRCTRCVCACCSHT